MALSGTHPISDQQFSPTVVTLMGMGNLDIFFAERPFPQFFGHGDGTFEPVVSYSTPQTMPMAMVSFTMDGDGHPDVAENFPAEVAGRVITGGTEQTILHGNADGLVQHRADCH